MIETQKIIDLFEEILTDYDIKECDPYNNNPIIDKIESMVDELKKELKNFI